jgi:hypothetical protein
MESKALVKALKIAVREVIKEELTEILREGLHSTVTELQTESVESKPIPIKKTNSKSLYSDNKFANILNETDPLREEGVPSYGDLMQEGMGNMSFTANDAQGFGMMRSGNAATQIMEDPESGKNMQVDPVVAKAMNRDYRGLMKAMDKKKNKGFAL